MAGFKKAKAEQAFLKMSIYGPPGSGKTFTALLVAEGLALATGKRIAVVDTERGTDFYAQAVADRQVHPEAFDFDAIYTRSLTEVVRECRALSPEQHGVILIDSVSHLWEAAMASYSGKRTRAGTIPMHAWSGIKKPYKDLMAFLINSPFHVLILGRQANEFSDDEETGESKATGVKMKAEGETQYEPHICIRMESVKPPKKAKTGTAVPTAFAEKDRSGVIAGKLIEWPDFNSLARPLLPYLGMTQARVQSEDEAALQDAEALSQASAERARHSREKREEFEARFKLAKTSKEVEVVGKQITAQLKREMLAVDVDALRTAYQSAIAKANGQTPSDDDDEAEREAIQAEA